MTSQFESINPANGKHIQTYSFWSKQQIQDAMQKAQRAQQAWRLLPVNKRAHILTQAADELTRNIEQYAAAITLEMGKPVAESRAEIQKCAWVCRYFAEHGPRILEDDIRPTEAKSSLVRYEPLGIILAIMPWNFPFWQVFRVAAPTLLAGNAILLKHALNVPQCALLIEGVWSKAGAPDGLFQTMFVTHDEAADIIGDTRIKGITLTGSNKAGEQIAQAAGRHTKPCVMELGGSDPFIVFQDVDIEKTAKQATQARCQNSGQSCIAAKRFFVERSIFDAFVSALVPEMQNYNVGPLSTFKQREILQRQVEEAIQSGASVLCGGRVPPGDGYFYPPTVLTNVSPNMHVMTQEVFGPVAPVVAFDTIEQAIQLANQTPFGLGASVWSNDPPNIEQMIQNIHCGSLFVNNIVHSDPRLPFGGIKSSGYGRELGREGLLSFVNPKTIWQS